MIADKPDWARDGGDWPLREHSRFLTADGLDWHVQVLGSGPAVLLLHGSAGASHSWAAVASRLAADFTVVVPDLPGHGFTATPSADRLGLDAIASSLHSLADALGVRLRLLAGHSAGAAIALRMALASDPAAVVGVAPSVARFEGPLSAAADVLPIDRITSFLLPTVATFGAALARNTDAVERLLRSTGSDVPADSAARYRMLIGHRGHTRAVLTVMNRWQPGTLLDELRGLNCPVLLIAGARDAWIPIASIEHLAAHIPRAGILTWPDAGHLAHEEHPGRAADLIRDLARRTGLLV